VAEVYGEELLVAWSLDEARDRLDLDVGGWSWKPAASARAIARLRKRRPTPDPLVVYHPPKRRPRR